MKFRDASVMHSQRLKTWASWKTRLHKAYEQHFIAYSDSKGVGSLRVTAYLSYVGEKQRLRGTPPTQLQGKFLAWNSLILVVTTSHLTIKACPVSAFVFFL